MRRIHNVCVLLILPVLLACGDERNAGGAGGETNTGLSARIIGMDGKPHAGVVARLRPSWYVREGGGAVELLPVVSYADAVSDSRGYVFFSALRPGNYRLDLESAEAGLLRSVQWERADTLVELGDVPLLPLGRVEGYLPQHSGARVQLYGTERSARVDSSGHFSLERLPPGERWLRITDALTDKVLGEILLPDADSLILVNESQLGGILEDVRTWKHVLNIQADMFLRDSAFESQPPWSLRGVPYLVRLNHQHLIFSEAAPDARDLLLLDSEGRRVAFAVHAWNPVLQQALLWIGAAEDRLQLYYGKEGIQNAFQSATEVWRNWTPEARDSLLSLKVDDFEDGDFKSTLPDYLLRFQWYLGMDSLVVGSFAISADNAARSAYALHVRYTSEESGWVVAGIRLADHPIDMSHLDSLVFWARGDGLLLAALENTLDDSVNKAWVPFALSTQWTRYCVRPADFAPPGPGGSVGWDAVRQALNTVSFFGMAGTEFWVDDISLHGLHPLELQ